MQITTECVEVVQCRNCSKKWVPGEGVLDYFHSTNDHNGLCWGCLPENERMQILAESQRPTYSE